jgi:hypothetical protein
MPALTCNGLIATVIPVRLRASAPDSVADPFDIGEDGGTAEGARPGPSSG